MNNCQVHTVYRCFRIPRCYRHYGFHQAGCQYTPPVFPTGLIWLLLLSRWLPPRAAGLVPAHPSRVFRSLPLRPPSQKIWCSGARLLPSFEELQHLEGCKNIFVENLLAFPQAETSSRPARQLGVRVVGSVPPIRSSPG